MKARSKFNTHNALSLALGIFLTSLLFQGCASIVQKDPRPTPIPMPTETPAETKHSSESTQVSTTTVSEDVYLVSRIPQSTVSTTTKIISEIEKTEVKNSSEIRIEDYLSTWQRVEIAFYRLFLSPAYANAKKPISKAFASNDMKKFSKGNPNAALIFSELESVKVDHDGGPQPEYINLSLKLRNGKTLDAVADHDWKRSCAFFDKALDYNHKLTFDTVDPKTKAKDKAQHPFEGNSCSKESMAAFKYYNFDLGKGAKAEGAPSAILIVSKDHKKGINFVFFKDGSEASKSLYSALTDSFAEPIRKIASEK